MFIHEYLMYVIGKDFLVIECVVNSVSVVDFKIIGSRDNGYKIERVRLKDDDPL